MATAARGRVATLLAALRQLLRNVFQLGRLLRLLPKTTSKGNSNSTVEGALSWTKADGTSTVISLDNVAFSMDPWARSAGNNWTQFGSSQIEYTETSAEVSEVRETTYEEVVDEVTETTQVTTMAYREEEENRSRLQKALSQSAIGISVSFENPRIKPIMPEAFQRNIARSRLGQQEVSVTIKPLTTTFVKLVPPPGWAHYTHPEGASYFCHHGKRIYTDADLSDPTVFQQALEDISSIDEFIDDNGIIIPDNTDLVLDLQYDEKSRSIQTVYFYVNHNTRSIFFLDNFEVNKLASWDEMKGAISTRRLHQEIEAQYWLYLQLYPRALEMSTAVVAELRDLVLYFIGNYMSSQMSNSSYTLDDLYKILTLTDNLEKNVGNQCLGAVSLLSQLMHTFVHPKLYAPPPQPKAVEAPPPPASVEVTAPTELRSKSPVLRQLTVLANRRTWLINSTSPLFFGAPNFYLRTLRGMSGSSMAWERSINVLHDEWRGLVVIAILLLLINVAFLGIHNVDLNGHYTGTHRSLAQISSYVSSIFTIGSVCLALVYMHNVTAKTPQFVRDVKEITSRGRSAAMSLEIRALVYSLPSVFFAWGIVAFILAFTSLCFQHSSKITKIIFGVFFSLVSVIFIVCCLWAVYWVWGYREYHGEDANEVAADVVAAPSAQNYGSIPNEGRGRSSTTSYTLSRLSYLPTFSSNKARQSQHESTV